MKSVSRLAGLITLAMCLNASSDSGTWTNAASGLWSGTANWNGGIAADGEFATAYFNGIDIASDTTVRLDTVRTIGGLVFGDTSTNTPAGWIVDDNDTADNILTLAGTAPAITVEPLGSELGTNKDVSVCAVLAGTHGLTKAGAGTLTLFRANTYSGNTTISEGTLQLDVQSELPRDGLALWLDATQGVTTNSSGNATVWADQSGNGRNATNAVSTGPTVTADINGRPTLRFTKSQSQYLACVGPSGMASLTLFVVHKLASVNAAGYAIIAADWSNDAVKGRGIHFNAETRINYAVNPDADGYGTTLLSAGTPQIDEVLDTNGDFKLFLNGLLDRSKSVTRTGWLKNLSVFRIGAWNASRYLDGSIGEILLYTNALAAAERQAVGVYLKRKWGITARAYPTVNVLPATTSLSITNGASLALQNVDQTISALDGTAGSRVTLDGSLAVTGNLSTAYAGTISGGGSLSKQGSGTLTLSGTNAYTGATTVDNGTLKITGSLYATGAQMNAAVTIRTGGVLELDTWGYGSSESLGLLATDAARLVISNGTVRITGMTYSGRAATVKGNVTLDVAAGAYWNILDYGTPWVFDANAALLLTGEGAGCFSKRPPSAGGILKTGTGKWTLTGTNTVAGPIDIRSGILQVSASTLPAGAALWLDATRGTVTNSNGHVTVWTDLSGNGCHALNTTSTGPTVTADINGQPTLRFTKSQSQYLTCVGPGGMVNLTVFIVHKIASLPGPYAVIASDSWSSDPVKGNAVHINDETTLNYAIFCDSTGFGTATLTAGTARIDEVLDTNGDYALFLNGAPNGSDSGTRGGQRKNLGAFRIGAWAGSATRYLDGSIGEILIYTNALSSSERQATYAYLNAKWMIPGGSGNPNAAITNLFATNAVVSLAAGATLDFSGQSQTLAGLYGSGLVTNGMLTVTDVIAPGGTNQIGTLSVAQTLLTGTLLLDVNAQTSDCIHAVGDLNLSGLSLRIANPGDLTRITEYAIATYTGSLTAPFVSVDLPRAWTLRYTGDKQVKLVYRSGLAVHIH